MSAVVEEQIKPYHETERFSLFCGDCRSVLPTLDDCSVDSIVCDPPYELGFMGKGWDRSGIAYDVEVWRECLRVLKPGGHLLAFGGSRTYHRLACAIEEAGFEIRDQIQWIYGSGFPKSLDVSKAIDAVAGAERETVGGRIVPDIRGNASNGNGFGTEAAKLNDRLTFNFTAPATDAAKHWNGWGTALKPAQEILTVAYKPHDYDGERDKIDANLSLLEARLWSLLPARIAAEHFQLSQAEQSAVLDSARWGADERSSIRAALLDPMDTSRCVSVMSTCLNTVRSWRSILDALCEITSTSTIETKTSLITDLRILNYSLSQTTPSIIIKAASQADGQELNALPVAQHFAAARLKLNGILTLSALDAATSKVHTLHRAGTESNGIVLARKPLIGTVAENVLQYGTGGLNIDGCRISTTEALSAGSRLLGDGIKYGLCKPSTEYEQNPNGRWPANVIHDGSDEVLAAFPDSPGQQGNLSGHSKDRLSKGIFGDMKAARDAVARLDSGSAARFFYCAKATQEDRNEGCGDLPLRVSDDVHKRLRTELDDPRRHGVTPRQNNHPTVKPTDLMRYLCRLVTPPGGIVLDPFCGSGSTGKAAMLEGFRFIGIELSVDYCELAQRRIEAVTRQGILFA